MDLLCIVCLENERCTNGSVKPSRACLMCGMQFCGFCVQKIKNGECPICRDKSFLRGDYFSSQNAMRAEKMWLERHRREDVRDLRWIPIYLGDYFYKKKRDGEPVLCAQSVKYYRQALSCGSPEAPARLYAIDKKIKDLHKFADKTKTREPSPVAQFNLALGYHHLGKYTRAFRYFSFAARAGHALAAFHLGRGYENKHGRNQLTTLDHTAAEWYLVAANAGFACAYFQLGMLSAKHGILPAFFTNMDMARSMGYKKATSSIKLVLCGQVSTGAVAPRERHCCVCYNTENLFWCSAECKTVYCSERCRVLDTLYGTHRSVCRSSSSQWLAMALDEIYL